MNLRNRRPVPFDQSFIVLLGIVCLTILSSGSLVLLAQQPAQNQEPVPLIPDEQLDSMVAPIALYPDPLLAQTLAASTYPLEIIQLQQFMANNKDLKDKALADAVAKHTWDPSVQAMAAFPEVVKQLGDNVAWSTDLGNAFLAQQADVMNAVQRMRAKAQEKGILQDSAQQTVETVNVNNAPVIEIQQANPDVVYVPTYNPAVVYGELPYPYPYLPPPYYGALAFGAGVAMGAIWGGCWGNCDWHGGDVNINNKNNFNKNNINTGNRNNVSGGSGKWQHDAAHRGGAPYGDRKTADKFGGRARQQPANRTRPSTASAGNRSGIGSGGANNLGGTNRTAGAGMGANRPGGAGVGNGNAGNRPGAGAGSNAAARQRAAGGGGANSVGNHSVSSGSGFGSSNSVFGSGGYSGSSVRSASTRGGSSMGGGGFSGGGGRGGGHGGGGGGRR